eukprot:scaffold1_cov402-Prasinococcus_capsulatus_cf.AAC.63
MLPLRAQEAGLSRRVSTLGGNAMDPWAKVGADVVLMSYILSALHKRDTQTMLQRAWDTLPPGVFARHLPFLLRGTLVYPRSYRLGFVGFRNSDVIRTQAAC